MKVTDPGSVVDSGTSGASDPGSVVDSGTSGASDLGSVVDSGTSGASDLGSVVDSGTSGVSDPSYKKNSEFICLCCLQFLAINWLYMFVLKVL